MKIKAAGALYFNYFHYVIGEKCRNLTKWKRIEIQNN